MSLASQTEVKLSERHIAQLSSEYLADGVSQDRFAIREVTIVAEQLRAVVEMTGYGVSKTDQGGYHLTAPSVFRFLGQLLVIHGQVYFGLGETKAVEVWVKEHAMKHLAPVRDPCGIAVEGAIRGVRRARSNPAMIGVRYEFTVSEGAVTGEATAFFDLTPFPAVLATLQLP
jgi:hypothetical protein